MHTKVKWVVFDVGGVLLNWRKGLKAVANHLALDEERVLDTLLEVVVDLERGKLNRVDGWKSVLKRLNVQIDETEKITQLWFDKQAWLEEGWNLVWDLHAAGFDLAICTNNWAGVMNEYAEKRIDFTKFKKIIDSSSEGVRKPDKKIYEIVEQTLGAKGSEIFFIDDSQTNLEGARQMGWQTFHYHLGDDGGKVSSDRIRKELLH
jgi:epoxide hydrolase-like predicted phosphatase